LASYYQFLVEPEKQIDFSLLTLSLAKEARSIDTSDSRTDEERKILTEILALQSVASAYYSNNSPKALDYYEQYLSSYRELKKLNSKFYNKKEKQI
jgi:hypothetical protein